MSYPPLPSLGAAADALWHALVSDTRDAVESAHFSHCVLGLSGGIDSAVVATLAVDALGCDRVHGVLMPSPFSSPGSITDAEALATNLGIKTHTLPLADIMQSFDDTLAPVFAGTQRDVTEENLQARIRGTLLMALSNKFGWYVLATGNRSEALAGYATLYGDMVGAFAPIGGLYKTHVYELIKRRNEREDAPVPIESITKPPSAELSVGQLDSDALPDYPELDALLHLTVDQGATRDEAIAAGFDPDVVDTVAARVESSAFKRSFAAPSPGVSF